MARWGWPVVAVEVLVFAFWASLLAVGLLSTDGRGATSRLVRITLWSGLALTAVVGIVAVFQVAGVLLLLGLAALSPVVRFYAHYRRFILPTGPEPVVLDRPTPPRTFSEDRLEKVVHEALPHDPTALDDAALCLAWRRSYTMLALADTVAAHVALVQLRQLYLDELQRRCPRGVAAWLASGARAPSNPMPFLGDGTLEGR